MTESTYYWCFYYFIFCLGPASPTARTGTFPFSPKGWISFFISLHAGGYHPSGCRYLRTPAGLSTISISSSPPPAIKIILRRAARRFYDCYVLSVTPPAASQSTNNVFYGRVSDGGKGIENLVNPFNRSSVGYLLNDERVGER